MDQELQHKGKRIIPYMDSQTLQHNVDRVAQQISIDYKDKDPIFIGVLNGAFMFMADVIRKVDKNIKFEIDFIKLSSYDGNQLYLLLGQESTGILKALSGIKANIKGRHVIIIEDIVETGITITHVIAEMLKMGPADVKLATCFLKKSIQ